MTPAGKGEAQIPAIFVGIFLPCLLLIGGMIAVALIIRMSHVKKSKHKKRLLQFPKCQLSARNDIFHEMSLLSPGIMKASIFEFPRTNLELQDVLGR